MGAMNKIDEAEASKEVYSPMALGFGYKRSNLGIIEKNFNKEGRGARKNRVQDEPEDSLVSDSERMHSSPNNAEQRKIELQPK